MDRDVADVDDFTSWERPAVAAARLLAHWAPVDCELVPVDALPDDAAWTVLAGPAGGAGDGMDGVDRRALRTTLAGLIGEVVGGAAAGGMTGGPDRRTGKLVAFLAEELIGRFLIGEPAVRVARGTGQVRIAVQAFKRTALLTVTAGGGEVGGRADALITVLESTLPLTNNECVLFDVGSGVHRLGPAADDDAVAAWWRAVEPWNGVQCAPGPDDEPRDERWDRPHRLDPAASTGRLQLLERLWGEVATQFGLDAAAGEPDDPAGHLAVWLWRDLVAEVDPGGSRVYEVAFPDEFEYGREDATGCLLFVGDERYGLVSVDASL